VETPLKALPIKRLSNIVKISACYGHFLALERADTEPVAQWPPAKVIEWFNSIGLGESCNVIRYQKISGAVIMTADDDFLADTLGIL